MYSSLILVTLALLPFTSAKEQYSNAKMVCMVNKERSRYGLRPLSISPQLTKAAQAHSDYQARTRKMTHTGPGGSNPGQRAKQAGYNWKSVAENVAYGYDTIAAVMKVWMGSPGHRANILGKSYTCMGSAAAYAGSTPYYTQDFGAGGSTAGQNVPKCDGSDSDYNSSSGGGNNYGNDSGNDYGNNSGNDYGNNSGNDYGNNSGNDYGNDSGNDYGGDQYGGQMGGRKGGNDYGNNDYGGDSGNDNYGGMKGGRKGGNDYGGDNYGNEGSRGGKKPCKKGKGGRGGSDY